jgi:drug/metabolite transporter (DMT)-like permease
MTTLKTTPGDEILSPVQAETRSPTNRNSQAIGIVLASVACGAVGQLVLKAGMNSVGQAQLNADTFLRMATNPLLLVGLAIFGISTLLWLFALGRADLSFAYPFLSLTYLVVLIGGAYLFGDQINLLRIVGFVVIVTGVFIVARSERRAT